MTDENSKSDEDKSSKSEDVDWDSIPESLKKKNRAWIDGEPVETTEDAIRFVVNSAHSSGDSNKSNHPDKSMRQLLKEIVRGDDEEIIMKAKKMGVLPPRCLECDKEFRSEAGLKQHYTKVHGG